MPNADSSLSSQALVRGKTVLVAESGRSGVVAASDITALVEASRNVLCALGMLERHVHTVARPTWLDGAGPRMAADSTSVFFARLRRRDHRRAADPQ